ncbi:PEGA domain-containing protein, partial [Archangium sp.]|uniref:PEGA domain-containing protein n=1 Tax=Archangium sp. TaxID=1872627 RepID=UPI002D3A6E12
NGPEYLDEPATLPGLVGTGRTVPPVVAPPSRPSIPTLAPVSTESTTVARQGRNVVDGVPRVVRPEPPVSAPFMAVPPRPSQSRPPVTSPPPVMEEEPEPPREPVATQRAAPALVSAWTAAAPNRLPLIAGLAALLVVALGVAGFLMTRPAPTGYILVNLPSELRVPVRVSFGGQELDTSKPGPVLQEVKVGPALVMVSAEGYKPFTQQVVIKAGMTPTMVVVNLEREKQVARVMIVTQPPDAELKVDGQVMRQKGSSATYFGELTADTEVLVEANAPGFKPAQQRINPTAGDKPMDVQLKLEPDGYEVEVLSSPPGATIVAGGKELGETPARVRLPLNVKQVGLKLRCHDEVEVDVEPGTGGTAGQAKGRLKKQRGCRQTGNQTGARPAGVGAIAP